jgi:hypothetical protein
MSPLRFGLTKVRTPAPEFEGAFRHVYESAQEETGITGLVRYEAKDGEDVLQIDVSTLQLPEEHQDQLEYQNVMACLARALKQLCDQSKVALLSKCLIETNRPGVEALLKSWFQQHGARVRSLTLMEPSSTRRH